MATNYYPPHQQTLPGCRSARANYLEQFGQQAASQYDNVYGYGTSQACGGNVTYYQQFDNADDTHCAFPHYTDRHAQYDQYRGKYCNPLPGWNKDLTRPLLSCCTYPGSCSGSLPYPYGQAHWRHCDPDYARYAPHGGGCPADQPRYLFGANKPYQYPRPPYPSAYRHDPWPYGEKPPGLAVKSAVAHRREQGELRSRCTRIAEAVEAERKK